MTIVANVVELVRREQAFNDELRAKYKAAQDTPEIATFLERVSPLLQAGWSRESPKGEMPSIYRRDRIGWVIFVVRPSKEHEGKLALSASATVGSEMMEFDTPEEVLAFVVEVEKELVLSPV